MYQHNNQLGSDDLLEIEKRAIEDSSFILREEASIYDGSLEEFLDELMGGILSSNPLFDENAARETIKEIVEDLFGKNSSGIDDVPEDSPEDAWDRAFGPLFD